MKKKLLLSMVCMLLMSVSAFADWTLWSMTTEEDIFNDNATIIGRVGYEFGGIEPWIGTRFQPRFETSQGETDPPTVMTFGCFFHFDDLTDQNKRPNWLPGVLFDLLPEEAIASPYIGPHGTFNFVDEDGGLYGIAAGLIYKSKENPFIELVAEIDWMKTFDQLSAVDDGLVFSLGVRYKFK